MLFTPGQIVFDGQVMVPHFVRAAMGLHQGTALHFGRLHTSRSSLLELVASPVSFESWQDTWRLECTCRDRCGLVADVTKLLRDRHLDILAAHAAVFASGKWLHLDIQFDASDYESEIDGNGASRRENAARPLLGLNAEVTCAFIDDLEFLTPDLPMLSVRRNLVLFDTSSVLASTGKTTFQLGTLDMSQMLAQSDSQAVYSKGLLRVAYVVADDRHLVLRVYLVLPDLGFCHVRLLTENSLGILGRICQLFRQRGFNIYQLYTRNVGDGQQCMVDLLVQHQPKRARRMSDKATRRRIQAIVKKYFSRKIRCKCAFPRVFDPRGNDPGEFCRGWPNEPVR